MNMNNRVQVFISIGSNIDPKMHFRQCLAELRTQFGSLQCSTVYRTAAVGFIGADFLNAVVGFETCLSAPAIIEQLRSLETQHGRVRTAEKFSPRPLDLDLLLYGEGWIDPQLYLPHPDILRYAFVLKPLAEIAGEVIHPQQRVSIATLWQRFEQDAKQQGKTLSLAPVTLGYPSH